jgi:hypothetical protein
MPPASERQGRAAITLTSWLRAKVVPVTLIADISGDMDFRREGPGADINIAATVQQAIHPDPFKTKGCGFLPLDVPSCVVVR